MHVQDVAIVRGAMRVARPMPAAAVNGGDFDSFDELEAGAMATGGSFLHFVGDLHNREALEVSGDFWRAASPRGGSRGVLETQ